MVAVPLTANSAHCKVTVPPVEPVVITPLTHIGSSTPLAAIRPLATPQARFACAVAHSKSEAEISHTDPIGAVTANLKSAFAGAF